jgi:hypothetical protein
MQNATTRSESPAVAVGFGSMEMLLKERHLERALTWVFPKIVSSDPTYWGLPFGTFEPLRLTLILSESGKIIDTKLDSPASVAGLESLIRKMTAYLALGRFVLDRAPMDGAVSRSFELSVAHRKSKELGGAALDPSGIGIVEKLGFDEPEAGRPGRGYVVDRAGSELVARVRELREATSKSVHSPSP